MTINETIQSMEQSLRSARSTAVALFEKIESENLIKPGIKESELNQRIYALAESALGIRKYWHKRIVRAGENTLCPYRENPEDLTLGQEEIIFLDFGPIFEGMEADFGRTYVLGNRAEHHALKQDLYEVWVRGRDFYLDNPHMTGSQLYLHMSSTADALGYQLADWHCGHLIGAFPHEQRLGEETVNYICPENDVSMSETGLNGEARFWILEAHITKPGLGFGGFVEDLLLPGISL